MIPGETSARPGGTTDWQVHGFASPDFEPVRRVFEENFAHHGESGAAVCVYRDGRPVVDLWGGRAGRRHSAPWNQDTVGIIFSATKGLTGICALHLADTGLLDLDAPVAEYWPEFAANRKERVTVSDLLSHRAGLPGFSRLMTIADMQAWDPLVEDLAAQPVAWEPGTAHGYHAFTFGWLVGEVVRRISGLTPGRYLREKICDPSGLDIWFGLPPAERHRYAPVEQNFHRETGDDDEYQDFLDELDRLAPTRAKSPLLQRLGATMMRGGPLRAAAEKSLARKLNHVQLSDTQRAFLTLFLTIDDLNSKRLLDIEFPAGNAICSARSLAKLYASLIGAVDGRRLLSPEIVARAATRISDGRDRVLLTTTSFGLGFMLPGSAECTRWGDGAFGHPGNGGSVGFADPNRNMAFGYCPKRITPISHYVRPERLIRATYECL